MPTAHCPACGLNIEHEPGVHTLGCPAPECRVVEFLPENHHA